MKISLTERSIVNKLFVSLVVFGTLTMAGCRGKIQPQSQAKPPHPPMPMDQTHGMMPPTMGGEARPVVIPDALKGKYSGVELVVTEKGQAQGKTYTVGLNKSLAVPGSDLVIEVGDYLPSLSVGENEVTSGLEENNPAVQIRVTEKGAEIYNGWLFQNFPNVHPFQHERFSISLKRGLRRG
jgi:hypothetical protein